MQSKINEFRNGNNTQQQKITVQVFLGTNELRRMVLLTKLKVSLRDGYVRGNTEQRKLAQKDLIKRRVSGIHVVMRGSRHECV